jgi:hypothetical protein
MEMYGGVDVQIHVFCASALVKNTWPHISIPIAGRNM